MKTQFLDHDYLFLKGNSKLFYEELERINPQIINIKNIGIYKKLIIDYQKE